MVLVPTTRRASARSRAPTACPIMMVLAMLMPNTTPSRKNRMMLALEVAVSAASPRKCPTHTALIEALSDCRILLPSTGSENSRSVRPIGPVVSWALDFVGMFEGGLVFLLRLLSSGNEGAMQRAMPTFATMSYLADKPCRWPSVRQKANCKQLFGSGHEPLRETSNTGEMHNIGGPWRRAERPSRCPPRWHPRCRFDP